MLKKDSLSLPLFETRGDIRMEREQKEEGNLTFSITNVSAK